MKNRPKPAAVSRRRKSDSPDGMPSIRVIDGVSRRIQRNVPAPAQALIDAAIAELSASRFAPALALFDTARDAFDDRPRRDRDACSNIFDSMESVAKEVFNMPTATFGGVLSHVPITRTLPSETTTILQALNTLRN